MGSLCSKTRAHSGSRHQVLGSTAAQSNDDTTVTPHSDPRAAAAEAAERRLKTAHARGTNASNPNRGRLAEQVETAKAVKLAPTPRDEERLVWD